MKAKKALLLLLVCALALLVFTPAATAKPDERPFKGVLTGEVWFTPGGELGLLPIRSPVPLHGLGGYRRRFASGIHRDGGRAPAATDFAGQMVLTAANGDKVYVDYVGVGPTRNLEFPRRCASRVTGHSPVVLGVSRCIRECGLSGLPRVLGGSF